MNNEYMKNLIETLFKRSVDLAYLVSIYNETEGIPSKTLDDIMNEINPPEEPEEITDTITDEPTETKPDTEISEDTTTESKETESPDVTNETTKPNIIMHAEDAINQVVAMGDILRSIVKENGLIVSYTSNLIMQTVYDLYAKTEHSISNITLYYNTHKDFRSDFDLNRYNLYTSLIRMTDALDHIHTMIKEDASIKDVIGPVDKDWEHWNSEMSDYIPRRFQIEKDEMVRLDSEGINLLVKYQALLMKLTQCGFNQFEYPLNKLNIELQSMQFISKILL